VELDSKVKPLAEAFASEPHYSEILLSDARARTAAIAELIGPGPEVASVDEVSIPVEGSQIGGRVYAPAEEPLGVIVFFHGGGWVIGEVEHYDVLARRLTTQSSCKVLSVEYRRAPEHPFPTAVTDCHAAFEWAAAELADGLPLVLAGDSAGGNLAATCAHLGRDSAGSKAVLQVLMYPVTDCDLATASYQEQATGGLLTKRDMVWFWDQYVTDPSNRDNPLASPLKFEDFSGLPAAVVVVPWFDPLRSEVEAYANRMTEAGVPVDLLRFPDQPHGFISLVQFSPAATLAVTEVCSLIKAKLEGADVL
jgi:acetyl esterase